MLSTFDTAVNCAQQKRQCHLAGLPDRWHGDMSHWHMKPWDWEMYHWTPGPVVRYLHKSIKSITTFNGETIPLAEQWVHTMPLAFLLCTVHHSNIKSWEQDNLRSGYKKTYHALWKNLNRNECIQIWNEFIPEVFSTIFRNMYQEWIHSGLEWMHSA